VQALPGVGIPLIIQDKTFVDATTIAGQDPTWRWGTGLFDPATGYPTPKTGDLWVSSVYMPAQNPWDVSGTSAFGRWMYGPWFFPPTGTIAFGPVANPYYDPNCNAAVTWCEPPMQPGTPSPASGMEAFNDTPIVNGEAYPYLEVDPTIVRFRILNAANDRFLNLSLFVADPTVVTSDLRTNTELAASRIRPPLAHPGFKSARKAASCPPRSLFHLNPSPGT
jgi:FtsP/CotA-like multicopper oxidase with cupredoxin domain